MNNYFAPLLLGLAISLTPVMSSAASYTNTDTHREDNFNDNRKNDLGPFQLRNTTNGNYVQVINKRLKFKWFEDNYLGNRNTRSAEIWSGIRTFDDYFVGYRIRFPENTFPDNKDIIVAQHMQRRDEDTGDSTWHATMKVENNRLHFEHRLNGGTNNIRKATIIDDIERNRWYNMIVRIRRGTGIDVWLDGERVFRFTDGAGIRTDTSMTPKWGMYNADVDGYDDNETRTLYMDDISVVTGESGSRGYDLVDPEN